MKPWEHLIGKTRSIRSILVFLVLAILFLASLVALWVVGITQQLARDSNQRLLEDTARALSMVLDLELAQRAAMVRALAYSRMLDTAPEISPQTLRAFDAQARRTLTGLEGWLEVRTANRVLLNTRLNPGEMPRTGIPQTMGALSEITRILPLTENEEMNIYHATLVQPVLRNGRAVLNLTLTMMPHEFQRIIDQQHIDADWVATILDSQGRVVARHPGGAAYAGRYATEDLRTQLKQAPSGLMHSRTLDGHESTIYYSTSTQGWTYVTGMPRSKFEGVVPNDIRNLALGSLLLLMLAVMAALAASQRIVRSIHFLKRQAQVLQSHAPDHATTTGIAECDEVALAMATASKSILDARSEMTKRVEQAITQTRNAEERIAHAQRLEALGRLTGGVAHDFNNLLGVISNSTHLMLRKTNDPQITSSLAVSLRAVETGSRLTQHLLRFAGRQSVRPRVIELSSFLPEAAELLQTLLGRQIKLSVSVDPTTRTVFADPNELELALVNLTLNARDAIVDSGRVEISATPAQPEDHSSLVEGDYVVISVTDDGGGIGEAIIERVFEPFFTTKVTSQASGLGLSQVYGFCVQSGGSVRLDSTLGLGTSVNMILPINPEFELGATPAMDSPPPIAGKLVLLVEDNEELRDVTSALLVSFGCKVTSCATAEEALEKLQKNSEINVLLSDVLLPGQLNGAALARLARQLRPELAVVLISGHRGDVGETDEFLLVQKPSTPETLVHTLQRALYSASGKA